MPTNAGTKRIAEAYDTRAEYYAAVLAPYLQPLIDGINAVAAQRRPAAFRAESAPPRVR